MEKAEEVNEFFFFILVFTGSQGSHISHILEPHIPESLGGNRGRRLPTTVRAEEVQDILMRLNVYKSMGPDVLCLSP